MQRKNDPGRRKRQLGTVLPGKVNGKKVFSISKKKYLWLKHPKPKKVKTLDKDFLVEDRRREERRSGKDRRK